jgi:hypothetical protein
MVDVMGVAIRGSRELETPGDVPRNEASIGIEMISGTGDKWSDSDRISQSPATKTGDLGGQWPFRGVGKRSLALGGRQAVASISQK